MRRRDFLGSVAGAATLATVASPQAVEPGVALPGEPLVFNMCGGNVMPAGVPCESNESMPRDEIRLYRGRTMIAKVTNLAVPHGYAT